MNLSLQSWEEIDCFILEQYFIFFICDDYNLLEMWIGFSISWLLKSVLRKDVYNNWRSKEIMWYLIPQPKYSIHNQEIAAHKFSALLLSCSLH